MTIGSAIVKQRPAVRPPPRQFLAVVCAAVRAWRGRGTLRHLRRSCASSERTLARQCRASCAWPACPPRVSTAALAPRAALSSVQDAACIPQRGNPTVGLGPFCNGGAKRADRGVEIAAWAVGEVPRRWAVRRAGAQTPPGAARAASKPGEEETRGDCYTPPLRDPRPRWPPRVPSPCVAGSFAKKQYIAEGGALKLPPSTKLRGAAEGRFLSSGPPPQRRGPQRTSEGTGNFHDRRRFAYRGPRAAGAQVQLSTALLWPGSLTRKRRGGGRVKRQAPPTPRDIVWAATDLALDGGKLGEYDGARFPLAFLFRAGQPFPGRRDAQTRAAAARACHCTAARAPLTLARAEAVRASPAHAAQVFSLASWQHRQCNERVLDLFMAHLALDPPWVKHHPGYDALRTYGAIAA